MPRLDDIRREANIGFQPITNAQIERYNSKPEVKERGVKLIQTDEEKRWKSSQRKKNFVIFLLLLVVGCFGVFTYLAFTDRLNLVHLNIPQCPEPPDNSLTCEKQECINTCPDYNFTCSPITYIYTNST